MKIWLLLSLLLFSASASAQGPVVGNGLRLTGLAGSPSNDCLISGAHCIWYDGSAGLFKTRDGGTDSVLGASIGNPITGGTAGSVLFINTSGNLAQDNANFNYTSGSHQLAVTGTLLLGSPSSGMSLSVGSIFAAPFNTSGLIRMLSSNLTAQLQASNSAASLVYGSNQLSVDSSAVHTTSPFTTSAGTPGNWTIGGQFQGASSASNSWFKYVPIDGTADPFWINHNISTAGGLLARPDHVMNFGWNLGAGGGLVNTGTRRGAAGMQFEDYWEQVPGDTSTAQMEVHLLYVDPSGAQHRPWSLLAHLNSPYASQFFIDAEQIQMGSGIDSNAPPSLSIQATSTAILAGAGYNKAVFSDSAGGFSQISSGNVGGTKALLNLSGSAAELQLKTYNANSGHVGWIGDSTASAGSFVWDNATTTINSVDGSCQVLLVSGAIELFCGGAPYKLAVGTTEVAVYNPDRFRLTFDNVGTQTRIDQPGVPIYSINNTAATLGAQQQYSGPFAQFSSVWNGSASQTAAFSQQVRNTPGVSWSARLAWSFSSDGANTTEVGSIDKSGNMVLSGVASAAALQTTTASVGVSGGSGATIASAGIGGAGQPTTGAQNSWIKMQDSTGATVWIPAWK